MDFHLFIKFNPIRKPIINGNITLIGRTVLKTRERQSKNIHRTLPTSMESSTATNSSFPAKLLLVIQVQCAGWNGCSGDLHRCGQYPMDLLRLPFAHRPANDLP